MPAPRLSRTSFGDGRYIYAFNQSILTDRTYECWADQKDHLMVSNRGYRAGKSGHWVGGSGAFLLMKQEFTTAMPHFSIELGKMAKNTSYRSYSGPLFPHWYQIGNSSYAVVAPSSDDSMAGFGTTAINAVKPTKPQVDLLVSIGELRADGLPKLMGHQLASSRTLRDIPSNLGSEYLNLEFGMKPALKDLEDVARLVLKSDKIISDYLKSANRPIKRSYSFPSEDTSSTVNSTGSTSPIGGLEFFTTGSSPITTTTRVVRDKWFEGQFMYVVPMGNDVASKLSRYASEANRLLGLRPTYETVWNLTPWTWMLDWFTNIGDIISNISSFANDGLVMTYGHVMETTVASKTVSMSGLTTKDGRAVHPSSTFTTTWKKRRGATPFGFATDLSLLTDRQRAILASLAVSRSNRQARRL